MDLGGMADRLSASVSAPEAPASSAPAAAPVAEPSVSTTSPAPAQQAPEQSGAAPDIQFDDDPEINFDEAPQAASPPPEAAAPEDDANSAADLAKVLNAGALDKRVEDALMKTNRGRHLLQTYKTMRDLRDAPEIDPETGSNRGGLGFIPNAEQIREFYKSHSDMQAMEHEFGANPQSWVLNWFGPDGSGTFRENVRETVAAIPQMLDQVYNQALQSGNEQLRQQAVDLYGAAFRPMLSSYLDGLYARARSLPEGNDRNAFLSAARAIEHDVFGKFRPDAELAPPKPDEGIRLREQQLQEREHQLKTWEMKNQSATAERARSEVFAELDRALTSDIEKVFAASNLKGAMKPFAYNAALSSYKQQIIAAVRQNAYAWRQYNFAMSKVGTSRGAEARTEAVKTYRQAAQQAIRNSYRTVLQDLVGDQAAQNQAAHSSAAAASARTAPAVNGEQPSPQSVVPQAQSITRTPGESREEFIQRRLSAVISGRAS